MPINVYWDTQVDDVIRIDVIGHWTWAEYNRASLVIQSMMEAVRSDVILIADFQQSGPTPRGSGSLQYVKRARENRPANYHMTINIDADVVARTIFLSSAVVSDCTQNIYYVDTLDDAYKIVQRATKYT